MGDDGYREELPIIREDTAENQKNRWRELPPQITTPAMKEVKKKLRRKQKRKTDQSLDKNDIVIAHVPIHVMELMKLVDENDSDSINYRRTCASGPQPKSLEISPSLR